jgi:hypothetical protein
MHLKQFSDEFIQKWLTPQDNKEYISQKDQKIKAGVNWLSAINQKSFKNLDEMYLKLNGKCKECLEKYCKDDFDWIIKNSIMSNENLKAEEKNEKISNLNKQGYEMIQFINPELFEEGIQRIKKFHANKKLCYEKLNLFRAITIRQANKWEDELNVCFNICKNKPLDKFTEMPDCFSTCMVQKSYEVVNNEYYMRFVLKKLLEEHENDKLTLPKVDLLPSYRLRERELNDHIVNKFL